MWLGKLARGNGFSDDDFMMIWSLVFVLLLAAEQIHTRALLLPNTHHRQTLTIQPLVMALGFLLPLPAASSRHHANGGTTTRAAAHQKGGGEGGGGHPERKQAAPAAEPQQHREGSGGRDRRQQLLAFTKAVAMGSLLGGSGLLGPSASSSLVPTLSQGGREPLRLGVAAPAWAEAAEEQAGVVVLKGKAMSTGAAARLIEEQCQPILAVYKAQPTQRFLYRGEDIHRPTLLATPPDLLDPVTYREEDATAFFQRVEDAMKTAPNAAETFPVRPSTGHLATSDIRSAAAWGTPCSVWPLGPLHYAWFKSLRAWWPMPEQMRAPTRDVASLRQFLLKEATVDAGLGTALSLGHEVLLKCELPSAGKTGGVTYGFLAVPIAYERELRARLGLKYD